ncbi:MAG: FMN-binding protein [Christensenellales bacterium]
MKKALILMSLGLSACLALGACTAAPAEQPAPTDDSVPTGEEQVTGEVEGGEEALPVDSEVSDDDTIELEPTVLTGVAQGFGGDVTVNVSIDENGAIAEVTVETPNETEGIGTVAAPVVAEAIVTAQSVNVDAVSGATMTSNAVIEAVTAALTEAGLIDNFNK